MPFLLNTLTILTYFVIIPQGKEDINELFCSQILSYIGVWFCLWKRDGEQVQKGTYSIKEDIKNTLGVYGLLFTLTLLSPIFIVAVLIMGVYLTILEVKERLEKYLQY